jgi:PadR family transcriptional regulator PadR
MIKSVPALLVLKALEREVSHGYRIAAWINQTSNGALEMKEGTLYPLLHSLEAKGLIQGQWHDQSGQRPVRMYRLTDRGCRELKQEERSWETFSQGVEKILGQGGVAHDPA